MNEILNSLFCGRQNLDRGLEMDETCKRSDEKTLKLIAAMTEEQKWELLKKLNDNSENTCG